jgi:small subunit ribosomal protein S2
MAEELHNTIMNDAQEENEGGGGVDLALLEKMTEAGILYGRRKNKTHPRMRRFIFVTRNGSEIFDLEKTINYLEKAGDFLKSIAQKKSVILCVGTTPVARDLIKNFAKKFDYPFVVERWLGGTLTNFKTLSKRLQYYIKLKDDREAGRFERYTKKERLQFNKEIERLTKLFGGLEKLKQLPHAVLIIGSTSHDTAVREARIAKIPIVSIISTDADPEIINYPIPANDRARSSIALVLESLEKKVEEGIKNPITQAETKPELKKEEKPLQEEKNKVE